MLERTAASLESCNIQRAISKSARSTKRYRRLHTGFWQHGASAIELSSIWPLSPRSSEEEQQGVDPFASSLPTGLLASTFLLDFLYPKATYSLLRRLCPTAPRSQESSTSLGVSGRRAFTSSTVATEVDGSAALFQYNQSVDRRGYGERGNTSRSETRPVRSRVDAAARVDRVATPLRASLDANGSSRRSREECYQTLTKLLDKPADRRYLDIWDLYCRLDESQKQDTRASVIVYLSTSHSIVEIGRAISLLRQVPSDMWSDNLQAAGVLLHLRAGDKSAAIDVFNNGLKTKACRAGLGYLLEDSVLQKEWSSVMKVWLGYFSTWTKLNPSLTPEELHFTLANITEDLGSLYFSFERYLELDAVEAVRAANLHADTRLGLRSLRRWMAEQVLQQPCPPKQAKIVLQIWDDKDLYQRYLFRMLNRINKGLETRPGLALLPEIYRNFRKLEGAEPSVGLLRRMFHFYYPADRTGLAEIYSDWHQVAGDLDQWGYEKFLKYYATTGDVQAVKDLWARYTARHPEVLRTSHGFRSTMDVFAQIGDVAGAEQEMRTMREQYAVEPDIDIWNTLLKCYTKTNNHIQVLQCFDDIKDKAQPNSLTYAQVMAMASKKGDIATTLDFFNRSQNDGVPVTREMAMSLVMVYCHNDRLRDAEKICIELTERKATSTAVWNQLLHFNGLQGNITKCYSLLKTMKSYQLEWDHQTHEFLLQAMVNVNQVQPAYRLVQSSRENKLFPVGPKHFAVVMSGAVRTGQLGLARTVLSQMRSLGHAVPFKAHVSFVEAAFRRNPSARRTRALARALVGHLRAILPSSETNTDLPQWMARSGFAELKHQTQDIGRTIMLLLKLRDFSAVEQIVSAYIRAFPACKQNNVFPPAIASALMLGYLREGKLNEVQAMWRQTMEAAMSSSVSPQGTVYPTRQYDLSRPFNIVATAFKEANDGTGLLDSVQHLTRSGFRLTNSNWNLAIRYLAEMGHWEQAMAWCEETLMSRWRGWTPAPRTVQERRESRNTRLLSASRSTVFALQREWLKLRKLAAWSAQVSSKLRDIEHHYPKLHYAFITTDYEHLPATWAQPQRQSMNKAIMEMLKPLSYEELKAMRNTLEKQLRVERRRRLRKKVHRPFRVATSHTEASVSAKRFNTEVLRHVHVELGGLASVEGAKSKG